MSLVCMFDKLASIERASAVSGQTGDITFAWSQVMDNVPCAIQPLSAASKETGAGSNLKEQALVFLPSGIDLRPNSESAFGDRLLIAGEIWLICSVACDDAGKHRLTAAVANRMSI